MKEFNAIIILILILITSCSVAEPMQSLSSDVYSNTVDSGKPEKTAPYVPYDVMIDYPLSLHLGPDNRSFTVCADTEGVLYLVKYACFENEKLSFQIPKNEIVAKIAILGKNEELILEMEELDFYYKILYKTKDGFYVFNFALRNDYGPHIIDLGRCAFGTQELKSSILNANHDAEASYVMEYATPIRSYLGTDPRSHFYEINDFVYAPPNIYLDVSKLPEQFDLDLYVSFMDDKGESFFFESRNPAQIDEVISLPPNVQGTIYVQVYLESGFSSNEEYIIEYH